MPHQEPPLRIRSFQYRREDAAEFEISVGHFDACFERRADDGEASNRNLQPDTPGSNRGGGVRGRSIRFD